MIIFFTTLVFIAQIVIVAYLLTFLIKTDKKVLAMTCDIEKKRTKLKWRLGAISEIADGINTVILPKFVQKLNSKNQNFALNILRKYLLTLLIVFLKTKHKRTLRGVKIGYLFAKGFLKA